jgi:hypothetical protein
MDPRSESASPDTTQKRQTPIDNNNLSYIHENMQFNLKTCGALFQ